ncbi:MAG: hypothetical protein IJ128_01285 [Firmicutes bacterium]|nr:hypothetical protein [Bacillota bacterium]
MNKRSIINEKLNIMQRCYEERDPANLDLIYDTFFGSSGPAVLIGTDGGAWFRTRERIDGLFTYDWLHWGQVTIDPWGFTITENGPYSLVRVKGLLDFHQGRAWDMDILMLFEEERGLSEDGSSDGLSEKGLVCRLMQFKIPRNVLQPVVIVNRDPAEMDKYRAEQADLRALTAAKAGAGLPAGLAALLRQKLADLRPDLADIDLPEDQLMIWSPGTGTDAGGLADAGGLRCFFFACTGLCTRETTGDVLPFRMVGTGSWDGENISVIDSEFSHPFVSALG